MFLIKKLEMIGRRFLLWVCGHLLSVSPGQAMEKLERIAVVRLDPRVGNLIMLTPLLSSLRERFPEAQIDVVVHHSSAVLLENHGTINKLISFNKKILFGPNGVFPVWLSLRQGKYDLMIDASNPTFPSTTQALIVRFSKSRYTTGVGLKGIGKIFTHPVSIQEDEDSHEIDLRLQLLNHVPGTSEIRDVSLGETILKTAVPEQAGPFAILNLGARLKNKQLGAETYAKIAKCIHEKGYPVLLTYGPSELALAQETQALFTKAQLAPPTQLAELASLMSQAAFTVSCDTGPMHIAAATGKAVLGIFVSTPPRRYGYTHGKNAVIDARQGFSESQLQELTSFMDGLGSAPST